MNNDEEFDEAALNALRAAATALPKEIAPNTAAWGNIRDRIEQARVRELTPSASIGSSANAYPDTDANAEAPMPSVGQPARMRQPASSWFRSTRGTVLIAATLFIAVTTLVVRQQGSVEELHPSQFAADTGRTDMTGVFARYDGAATDLVNDLERRRPRLDPAAVAVLDSALYTIDEAIRETRDAMKDAPDNATIVGLLEVTYQQKLDLLRRASELSEVSFQE